MDKASLAELAQRFLAGTATNEEKALLHQWYDVADREEIELVFLPKPETEDDVRMRIKARLQAAIGQENQKTPRRIGYYARWIAAAVVLVAVSSTGLYFWNAQKAHRSDAPQVAVVHRDLPPGGNKATLLLGDGSTVNLGTAQNGVIRKLAGTLIAKQDGQLRYDVSGKGMDAEMNTIRTPRGGQYEVILPDSTKVWLNAASSLTYPTAFTGTTREVQLKGEAYFEVAGDKNKPFRVVVDHLQVNVLGTHFNVMAYEDEGAIKTTLLEGSVKVTEGGASHLLKPGQEGRLDRSSGAFKISAVDANEAVAWKNGVFQFGGANIEAVMRAVVRWYDVDVEYQGRPTEHFRGTISRGVNASEVFKMLELTGAVHFTVDEKKIIVKP
ncbi:MAG TPA: FecR family protein [Puia sp.]|nr:FecR family protein [Puia sp.]